MSPTAPEQRTRRYSRATLDALALLGRLIRVARIERGWSAQQLADRAGISRPLLQRIEDGNPQSGVGAMFEAASIAGVPLFDQAPGRLDRVIAEQDTKLRLLPKAVHKKRAIVDDF